MAHNSGKYSSSFTAKARDWELYLLFEASDFNHALRLEKKIKRMKSRVYIQNLKKYPELRSKIIKVTSKS